MTTTTSNGTTNTTAVAIEEALCRRIGLPRFQLWFCDKTRLACQDDAVIVGVPNHFYQDWLQKTFAEDVREAARAVLGRSLAVRFDIDPELFQAARRQETAAKTAANVLPAAEKSETRATAQRGHAAEVDDAGHGARSNPRRWRNLDDFVVGACNRVAHASALGLTESPLECPSPLVLHGPVGTGKTHLLEGIWSGLRQRQPHWRICFVTSEDFTNRFLQSMRHGKLPAFRKQFRHCDVLLLDDLNFLSNKTATQEEFLHTLNELHANDRLLAVTCDCHPRLTDQFLPELADRLLGGAVWGLALPDRPTRLDLLRAKAGKMAVPIAEDVLAFLADQLSGNVRELEGALHNVRHFGRVVGRPIDLTLARQAIGDLLRQRVRTVPLADVDQAVCTVLGLQRDDLHSKNRCWRFSHPRMLAMFLARKHTGATYADIGRHFGGRNHSTTVAAEKKVRQWLKDDSTLTIANRQVRVQDVLEQAERLMNAPGAG